jgi:pimeloyl-ACP methyl ester carboxylesterase
MLRGLVVAGILALLSATSTATATSTASTSAFATTRKVTTETCGKTSAGAITYNYCVFPSSDINNKDLIIHFHGLGGSAQTWKNTPGYQSVRTHAKNMGKVMPTVVSVSLGKLWLLTEVSVKLNRYSSIVTSAIPFLESLAGYTGEGRRILLGESMGGFNALQVFFRNPNSFDKVAILCPAVADLSPWSTEQEINDFIQRTGAQSIRVAFFMDVAADEFPTPLDWENHNPLVLAHNFTGSRAAFYMSGNENDEYGFYEGVGFLDGILKTKFARYQYEPLPSTKHCDMNTRAVAKFLTSP